MSSPAAMMAAQTAQSNAMMVQQGALQMAQQQQSHNLKMAETASQGNRHRTNMVEKFNNDMNADAMSKGKQQHDSASQAAGA